MKEAIELVKLLMEIGIPGTLFVTLLLIIHEPTRAEKLKALILQPTFLLYRWGSKQYLSAKVGGTVTSFLRQYIGHSLLSVIMPRIQIRWVSSLTDPILLEDGTLILCMEDSNDQTRNILLATRVALPHIVCPTLRSHISKQVGVAIDLAVLKKLTDGLGRHARPLFQRYFLEPEVDAEQRTAELFQKLVEIDSKGYFIFIFLEELNLLGDRLFRTADLSDKTAEVEGLLEFLLTLARRGLGEKIDLEYHSKEFRIGIVLVAITSKANTQGVVPYLKAVDFSIAHGNDSIYLIGFQQSAKTFYRTIDALDSDNRVAIEKNASLKISPDMETSFSDHIYLAFARVIRYMGDATFEERINAAGIRNGMQVDGIILDVMQDGCAVDVRGLRCNLKRSESAWNHLSACTGTFALHDKISVIVKNIDLEKGEIEVSRRLPDEDPWRQIVPPDVGDTVEIAFTKRDGAHFFGLYNAMIEIRVPVEELSWLGIDGVQAEDFLGAEKNVQILNRDDQQHTILASVRLLEENPWPNLYKRYPKNTELRGVVCDVNHDNVLVKLQDGLVGHIPRESMLKAGFEFADYENSVVIGQGLDVVVTKVFLEKKRIRLDLKRNVEAARTDKN